ncbi:hypothetical protein BOTBODRAFT_171371 [Botryobasidium botryosum FD-172 SS1]|uniref:Protein kinase domain-containing protein n=1 Tax=Botryobasidium botryosum (strain FD-172 SS1) TaxID=930990 RepID=A0A067MS23_BOTB1|nr:hypothetical protein BOTBODRAFT_171371 [Botryobasidium botryosum FD-172 SS1]
MGNCCSSSSDSQPVHSSSYTSPRRDHFQEKPDPRNSTSHNHGATSPTRISDHGPSRRSDSREVSRQPKPTTVPLSAVSSVLDMVGVIAQCAPVPGLGPAVGVLQGIVTTFEKIKFNREQCGILSKRSATLLLVIKENWNPNDERLRPHIDDVVYVLQDVETSMEYWVNLTRFSSFVNQWTIASDIEDKLRRLDECIATFNVAAQLQLHQWHHELAEASKNDSQMLEKALKNQEEMKESNHDNQKVLEDMMREMQTQLRGLMSESERRKVQHKLLVVQNTSGKNLPITELRGKIECERIGDKAVAGGGAWEIWEGLWLGQKKVALKVLRGASKADVETNLRRSQRQLEIWSGLNNRYILPLYGTCSDDGPTPYLVSPWCENGDAVRYLEKNPSADRIKLCLEVAYGLQYLHSKEEPIIHGGLKGTNVLISDEGSALLADFGFSNLLGAAFTNSAGSGNSLRWMAPEMQDGQLSKACDIWAWAMTSLELLSGKQPFYKTRMPAAVYNQISKGKRPEQSEYDAPDMSESMWSLLTSCWTEAAQRPTIDEVVSQMEAIHAARQSG